MIHVQVIDLDDTAPVFDLDLSSFEILEFDDLGAGFSSTLIFLFRAGGLSQVVYSFYCFKRISMFLSSNFNLER